MQYLKIIIILSLCIISIFTLNQVRKIRHYLKSQYISDVKLNPDNGCSLYSEGLGLCNIICTLTACSPISKDIFIGDLKNNNILTILEIGPYVNPTFKGKNVKYFDVITQAQIKEQVLNSSNLGSKYPKDAETHKIPVIDFVEETGDLSIIKEKFDIVYSSHNLEHQLDIISHLNQVADILNDNGKFYLIIPDKRYCFDHYISQTYLSDVIANNYYRNEDSFKLRAYLSTACEITHNNTKKHWEGSHGLIEGADYNCYTKALEHYTKAKNHYLDSHRWRFTPEQFVYIISSLYKMNLIALNVEKVYNTVANENQFYAILYKPSEN